MNPQYSTSLVPRCNCYSYSCSDNPCSPRVLLMLLAGTGCTMVSPVFLKLNSQSVPSFCCKPCPSHVEYYLATSSPPNMLYPLIDCTSLKDSDDQGFDRTPTSQNKSSYILKGDSHRVASFNVVSQWLLFSSKPSDLHGDLKVELRTPSTVFRFEKDVGAQASCSSRWRW